MSLKKTSMNQLQMKKHKINKEIKLIFSIRRFQKESTETVEDFEEEEKSVASCAPVKISDGY